MKIKNNSMGWFIYSLIVIILTIVIVIYDIVKNKELNTMGALLLMYAIPGLINCIEKK